MHAVTLGPEAWNARRGPDHAQVSRLSVAIRFGVAEVFEFKLRS